MKLASDVRGIVSTEAVVLIVCIMVLAIVAWQTFGETVLRLIEG